MLRTANPMLRKAIFAGIMMLVAACVAMIGVSPASAQSGGGTVRPSGGYNGMFGSGTFNNSGSNSALGSTMGSTSGSSFGSSSSQAGQSTGGIQRSEIATGGPQSIQSQNFIGNSAATATNVRSMQGTAAGGQGGRGGQNSLAGLQGLFSQMGQPNGFNQNGQQDEARMPLSIPIRLGFPSRPFVGTQFAGRFENRLAKLPALKALGPIEVTMDGQTAILTGRVATEADRQLAEGVARLEPEVADVQNDLVVDSAATSPADVPLPRER